jgi:hypothetical protein
MDRNTELLLAQSRQLTRWEDEEKATSDVEELREEFRRLLYGDGCAERTAEQTNGVAGTGSKDASLRRGA